MSCYSDDRGIVNCARNGHTDDLGLNEPRDFLLVDGRIMAVIIIIDVRPNLNIKRQPLTSRLSS